ncbi:MAG: 1-acyl-sn-glycerol-3-phosphate acyltransferase [Candidatus Melainabacteria bacterium]|nr:1-acyl-sn-glycerol-3-phosphate acyltransferase [Candidatus Melainabacteria bacterium]MBI3309388.1 1-acyl-sn-glycerol-3-phosphate acyltransferase [Candidatus Melainabacteria bacterium]
MKVYRPNHYNPIGALYYYLVIFLFLTPFYRLLFKIKVKGKENIPKDKKTYIVMPNHISNFDPPLVSVALRIPIAYMAKIELFQVPVLRELIYSLSAFSVNREKVELSTIKFAGEILKKGWHVGMFLEGTRSKISGKLGYPNIGPAYLALKNKVQILPVGITGSYKFFEPLNVIIGKAYTPKEHLEEARWECAEKLSELTGYQLPDK